MIADKDPVIAPIDQDDWARNLGYMEESPAELVALYGLNRHHNTRVLRRLKPGDLEKSCISSGIEGEGHPGELHRKNWRTWNEPPSADRTAEEGSGTSEDSVKIRTE